jgi:hypothetical protein
MALGLRLFDHPALRRTRYCRFNLSIGLVLSTPRFHFARRTISLLSLTRRLGLLTVLWWPGNIVSICIQPVVVVFPTRCVVLLYRTRRRRCDSAVYPDVGTRLRRADIAAFLSAPHSFIFVLRVLLTTPHALVLMLRASSLHTSSSWRIRRLASNLGSNLLFSVPVQRATRMAGEHLSLVFKPHRPRWRSNVRHYCTGLYTRRWYTSWTIAIHARSQHTLSLRRHARGDLYRLVPQRPWRNLDRMACN